MYFMFIGIDGDAVEPEEEYEIAVGAVAGGAAWSAQEASPALRHVTKRSALGPQGSFREMDQVALGIDSVSTSDSGAVWMVDNTANITCFNGDQLPSSLTETE